MSVLIFLLNLPLILPEGSGGLEEYAPFRRKAILRSPPFLVTFGPSWGNNNPSRDSARYFIDPNDMRNAIWVVCLDVGVAN